MGWEIRGLLICLGERVDWRHPAEGSGRGSADLSFCGDPGVE